MISIILIEPELSENVGFIARAMKNFGLKNLVLIEPKCSLDKAIKTAKHAKDVLKKAKVEKKGYLDKFDYLIGTTSKLGTDYNIPRSPLTPEQLAEKIKDKKNKIAILFGRESIGLTNKEILKCDFVVTIPASRKYSALNISHAATVIFYELFKRAKEKSNSHIVSAGKKEKDVLFKEINKLLGRVEFSTKEKKETQKKVWKRVIGKAFLTKREIFALIGFFKKLK